MSLNIALLRHEWILSVSCGCLPLAQHEVFVDEPIVVCIKNLVLFFFSAPAAVTISHILFFSSSERRLV